MSRAQHLSWIVLVLLLAWLVWLAFQERERGAPRPAPEGRAASRPPLEEAELVAPALAGERRAGVSEPRASAEERASAAATKGEVPFHGRVLDVATGDPVAHVRLVAGELEAAIGADGRFTCERALGADVGELRFHDPFLGTHIRTLPRERLEPDGDGFIARIAIGPTYRLEIPGASEPRLAGWRVRLVEVAGEGGELHEGDWNAIHPFDVPFLRYDNPWRPNLPGSWFRVEVQSPDGTRRGESGALRSAVGLYPEIVRVPLAHELATLRGRVVNTEGDHVDHVFLRALPSATATRRGADEDGLTTENGEDGEFEFRGLVPGAYRLYARPRRGEEPRVVRVELPAGVTVLADIVVETQVGVGAIEGRLVSATGAELTEQEHVRLRALDGHGPELLDSSSPGGWGYDGLFLQHRLRSREDAERGNAELGVEGLAFEFNEVPAGRFELSVVPRDGFLWDPPSVVVEAPRADVVFTRRDDLEPRSVRFHLVDAETGQPTVAQLQLQFGTSWNPLSRPIGSGESVARVTAGVSFTWSVGGAGYRPVHGTERDLELRDGALEATLRLEKGFGTRFVLRDVDLGYLHDDRNGWVSALQRPPVCGAAIVADGRQVATSDALGVAELVLDHEPERIEIRASGWRVLASERFEDGRLRSPVPEVLVWMIAE